MLKQWRYQLDNRCSMGQSLFLQLPYSSHDTPLSCISRYHFPIMSPNPPHSPPHDSGELKSALHTPRTNTWMKTKMAIVAAFNTIVNHVDGGEETSAHRLLRYTVPQLVDDLPKLKPKLMEEVNHEFLISS